jgi:predicted permease
MNTLWQDVRYAFRMLAKNPGFTAIALLTLAIGIGANTIMFSIVNVLLLRPTVVRDPDQLVSCVIRNGWCSYSAYIDIRNNNPAFSDLMARGGNLSSVVLVQGDVARRVIATFVSANYFSMLGVAPARGRGFLPEEERYGAEPVAVISHRMWRRQGADPNMVGAQIAINATLFRVIGIAPERFTGETALGPDLWLPLGSFGLVTHAGREKPERTPSEFWNYSALSLVGRLRPGLTPAAAQVQLQTLLPHLKEGFPKQWRDRAALDLQRLPRLVTISNGDDRATLSGVSLFLMSISTVVLLIACLNLANMIVVQGAARHRELAIRMAIGGGRLRIVRQLLVESLLLALLGGTFGLALAFWGIRMLNASVAITAFGLVGFRVDLDLQVLAATLCFCLVAAVLSGLRPALRLSQRDIIADLKESAGGALRSARRTRRPGGLSVICQIALSVVLVMGAALFSRAALKTTELDPDFSYAGKLVVEVDPVAGGYNRARSVQVCEALADRLSTLPGIQAVGVSESFPFGGGDFTGEVREYAPGLEDEAVSRHRDAPALYTVGVNYFAAMGLGLQQGRSFQRLDSAPNAEKVVIIDERLARKLRPDGNALGCLIQYGFEVFGPPYRVIGIVPHLRAIWDDHIDRAHVYLPMAPDCQPAYIHVRAADSTRGADAALLQRIRSEIGKLNPELPMVSVATLADHRRRSYVVSQMEMLARLVVSFGVMALFLASLGIYAVKGYMVASRTSEIGIRKALGAAGKDIMGMVLREGLMLTLVGLGFGLLLGLAGARLITGVLYGVSPADPVSIAVAVALLGVASLLASYIPARRAAKVDPMVALRCE